MAPPSKPENRCSAPGAQLISWIDRPKCWRPTRAADFADTRPGIFPALTGAFPLAAVASERQNANLESEWGVADMPERNADRPPCQLVPTPRSADCRPGIRHGGNHASSRATLDADRQSPSPLNAGKIADGRQRWVVAGGAR